MKNRVIENAINEGNGILKLLPNWIPRTFNKPGKRLRLHPDDYLGLGIERGFIEERWLSSTTNVQLSANGSEDEGLSFINFMGEKASLRDAVDELGRELIGDYLQKEYGRFPIFSKFYDYYYPSFLHVHHMKEAAEIVGAQPKPEAYYFPPQMNNHYGKSPTSFFGFDPTTTKDQIMESLKKYEINDNHILELSRGYHLKLGTGWYTPAGVLHSTGSLCTYEPQWCSDVSQIWQNVDSNLQRYDYSFLASYVPKEKERDLEYIFSIMDWEINLDPEYRKKYFRPPIIASEDGTYIEKWVTYGTGLFGAKELTVYPGQTVTIKDQAAYGCVIIQGHGSFGKYAAEAAQMIRIGQDTADEFFVSEYAALHGVKIVNSSPCEPMVILKHFAKNCGMPE